MNHAYLSQPHKMHLGYLDGLRALAAIFVVVHHAFLQVWPEPDAMTGSSTLLAALLKHGHYAVDLFIVLSGFCLMMPVVKGDGTVRGGSLNFYLRRAWRILPPYYLALALTSARLDGRGHKGRHALGREPARHDEGHRDAPAHGA